MFVIGRQAISISTPPKLMGHMATFALVVSFGTAAAPGAATYRGETTIWEVREGSKIQSPAVVGAPCGSNTTTTTTRTATAATTTTTTTTTTTRLLFCIGVLQKAPIPYVFLIFFPGVGRVEGQIHLGKRNKLIDSQVPAVKEYGLVPRKVSAWTDNVCELHTNPAQSVNQSDTQKSCPIMMSPKCESSKKTKTKMQTKSGIRWKHSAY